MTTLSLPLRLLILCTLTIFSFQSLNATIYESTEAGGLWSQTSTWIGGGIPLSENDTVVLNGDVSLDINIQIQVIIIDTNVIFQNAPFANFTLGVNGKLINYGIIQNNVYNLYINLWGGLDQHGVMSNYQLKLYNTAHDIDASQPFNLQEFNLANGGKDINVLSDTLHFIETNIYVLGANFYFNNGSLTLDGGNMSYPDIFANTLDLNLLNGAYLEGADCTTDYAALNGTFNSRNNTFNGNGSDCTVEVKGILQNNSASNYGITVNGNLINNGTIQNNVYNLTLSITGDLTNHGTWKNQTTNLIGDDNQTFNFSQPFTGASLINTFNGSGNLIANSDLQFIGTNIDLNNDTLFFSNSPANLTLTGGYIREYKIKGMGSPNEITIDFTSNAYSFNGEVIFDNIFLENSYLFSGFMYFNGNTTVQGSLQNSPSSNYAATMNGNLINNGTISNNVYNLTLNITNDMVNNGIWTNQTTNLSGAEDQSIYLNNPFSGSSLNNTNGGGRVIAQTDLKFNNTIFDMNLDTLVFAGTADSLVINENNLRESIIVREASKASGTLKINFINGAWAWYVIIHADQVDLYGTFQFGSYMRFYANEVINHGILRNYASGNFTAEIFGNFQNLGTVSNNVYNLYLNITGDITQNGSWSNHITDLTGSADQTLAFYQPFNGAALTNTNTTGKIITTTDLVFNNTTFDLNADTLEFIGAADSLSFIANNFREAVVIREDSKASGTIKFNFMNNAYLTSTSIYADQIDLYGEFQFSSNMHLYGNVANFGTLQNYASSNYNCYIYGNIHNVGSIQNNVYNLNTFIEGDIQQHGNWSCQTTYLIGSSTQTIHQTQPFKSASFNDNDGGSNIILTSDFVFENTNIDLNGATVNMPVNAVLSLKNGSLREADFPTDGIEISQIGTGTFDYVNFVSPKLIGVIQVGYEVEFFGHVTVMGTLQNVANTNHVLHIDGSIENHGSIQDNVYQLQIYIQEDVLNNGAWTNTFTQLEGYEGSINQTVELQDGHYITGQLRLFSNNSSNYLWYKNNSPLTGNPDYSGTGSQVLTFLVPADNVRAGEYDCNTSAGWSRLINIITTSSNYAEVELTVMLEGPFNGTGMNTDLNSSGNLSLTQPYDAFSFNYYGPENVASIPNSDIVDWVLIEFREAVDANNADLSTRVSRQAAFLLNDGSVVGLDGTGNLTVPYNFTNNMFVLIHHRNHLGVMSAVALNETGGVYSYDFSYDTWNAFGGPFASKNIGTDLDPIYGMMGGDSNSDGIVDNEDYIIWSQWVGAASSYQNPDHTLDGQINNQDKNDAWVENLGQSVQYPQ